ncbi:unnamed protein product [Meloidogyne enterolobii]|uniref:Uncharacterized protein n=1 Tax=Meloidogyne enterolobii TaxID=390850 RepID=A0ACB0YHZ4_MELEN
MKRGESVGGRRGGWRERWVGSQNLEGDAIRCYQLATTTFRSGASSERRYLGVEEDLEVGQKGRAQRTKLIFLFSLN